MTKYLLPAIFCLITLHACTVQEKPLTKEEVKEFGKQLELSIEKRDEKFFDHAIDEEAVIKRMNAPEVPAAMKTGIKKGIKIGTQLTASLSPKGSYSLVKQYEKENVHHLLFRLYDNGMLNYHDLEMKRTNGKAKIADIFIYLTGENFSATLKNVFEELKDHEDEASARWAKRLPNIRSLISANKHREAFEIYNSMPKNIQRNRTFMIVRIEICSGLSDEEYKKAIEEYESRYPNEPNMQLLLINGYIMREEYDKAIKAVDELDKMIDKDPLLDLHRANCYALKGDDQKQRECLERLVKNLPDFEDGLISMIDDYLEHGEYDKAKPHIDYFRNFSSFDQQTLTNLIDYYPGYTKKYGNN